MHDYYSEILNRLISKEIFYLFWRKKGQNPSVGIRRKERMNLDLSVKS